MIMDVSPCAPARCISLKNVPLKYVPLKKVLICIALSFGLFLLQDMNGQRVELIKKTYSDCEMQTEAIIDTWIQKHRDAGTQPRWEDFTTALHDAGMGSFALRVNELLSNPEPISARVPFSGGARQASATQGEQHNPRSLVHSSHSAFDCTVTSRAVSGLGTTDLMDQKVSVSELRNVKQGQEDFFRQVVRKGKSGVMFFASELLGNKADVDSLWAIAKRKQDSMSVFTLSVIETWINMDSSGDVRPPTWQRLISALQDAGIYDVVVDNIRKYLTQKG